MCPGRPRTDKLDCGWPAKLTDRGMLRSSFVRPRQIRVLRDYIRMRVDLVQYRTRHYQRREKLPEDALIKVSAVASTMTTLSIREVVHVLIRGECDPHGLAGLARGRMRHEHHALVEALTGWFDERHAELAQILLAPSHPTTSPGISTRPNTPSQRAVFRFTGPSNLVSCSAAARGKIISTPGKAYEVRPAQRQYREINIASSAFTQRSMQRAVGDNSGRRPA
jgi:hypothetical protein